MDFEHGVWLCALQEETMWDSYDSLSVMHEKNNNTGPGYADCRETARGEKAAYGRRVDLPSRVRACE